MGGSLRGIGSKGNCTLHHDTTDIRIDPGEGKKKKKSCREIHKGDPKIKLIKKKNRGGYNSGGNINPAQTQKIREGI